METSNGIYRQRQSSLAWNQVLAGQVRCCHQLQLHEDQLRKIRHHRGSSTSTRPQGIRAIRRRSSPQLSPGDTRMSETRTLTITSKKHGRFDVLIDAEDWERVSQHTWHVNKDKNDRVY